MASALEKAMAQRNAQKATAAAATDAGTPEQARKILITRLKALPEDKIVAQVEKLNLPSTTSKWTLEQLREVVVTLETGKAPEKAPAAPRSLFVVVDSDLNVVASGEGDAPEVTEEQAVFDNLTGPDKIADMPDDVKLAVYNAGKGTSVKKLAKAQGDDVVYEALTLLVDNNATKKAGAAKKAATKKASTPKAPTEAKVINFPAKPKGEQKQVKAGTKIAQLIDLLNSEEGTTLEEITTTLSASGKPVNARAWLGYDLRTVAGYGARQEGDRLFLVLPEGMDAPLDHRVAEEKAAPAPKAEKAAAPAKKLALVTEEGGEQKAKETPSERMKRLNEERRAKKAAEEAGNKQVEEVVEVPAAEEAPAKPAAKKAAKKAK